MDTLNEQQDFEGKPKFTKESIKACPIEILIEHMKELDHKDKLYIKEIIKDELQSYNVLKNDQYKRFKRLKEVLDDQKRT